MLDHLNRFEKKAMEVGNITTVGTLKVLLYEEVIRVAREEVLNHLERVESSTYKR